MSKQVTVNSLFELTPVKREPFAMLVVHGNSPDKKRPFLAGIELFRDDGNGGVDSDVTFVGAFTSKVFAFAAARDRAALHLEGPILVDDVINAPEVV